MNNPDTIESLRAERDALQRKVDRLCLLASSINLSPCGGGSCMVATDAEDALAALQSEALSRTSEEAK